MPKPSTVLFALSLLVVGVAGCKDVNLTPTGRDWSSGDVAPVNSSNLAIYIPTRDFQFTVPGTFKNTTVSYSDGLISRLKTSLGGLFTGVETTDSGTRLRIFAKDGAYTHFAEIKAIRIGFNTEQNFAFIKAYFFLWTRDDFAEGEALSQSHNSKVVSSSAIVECDVQSIRGEPDKPLAYDDLLTKLIDDLCRQVASQRDALD